MARFDVYYGASGKGYLLDCQTEILKDFDTRIVVPLLPHSGMTAVTRLHPTFEIKGQQYILSTQLIFAIPRNRLSKPIANLSKHSFEIIDALDMLISGY
ncbi:hypothetical protein LPB140_05725 [Sphingorhabdus lutea]|uniref:Toxin CcdB n=1 Tax=Sphingorhabdus lutea TaxID=1913578 RepID=A0A1L3JB57_9SPHN|nr:CcdB family protein [Sphingorhabdus lutea]APG62377.1 hypothetical protein LPB140_05725 [Sphingorhabdus lutea]